MSLWLLEENFNLCMYIKIYIYEDSIFMKFISLNVVRLNTSLVEAKGRTGFEESPGAGDR